MDQSRMIRWAKKGAQYGFVAAGGLAALGVMLGPRSMVLPIAGVAALPTFLPFLRWQLEYYAPLNEWAAHPSVHRRQLGPRRRHRGLDRRSDPRTIPRSGYRARRGA